MGIVLSSSPSSLMSRNEPEGLTIDSLAAFLVGFLADGFVFVAGSSVAAGAEIVFTSGEVFSVRAFLGTDFGAAVFVGGLSPGLMAG